VSAVAADGRIHHLSGVETLNIDGVGVTWIGNKAGINVLVIRGLRITCRQARRQSYCLE
jgi:hypothetical protein